MRRLTILIAAIAALLLVPAAQAFAAEGTFKLLIEGTGSGTVVGEGEVEEEEGGPRSFPTFNCSGPPATGACEAGPYYVFAGFLEAAPDAGSEITSWTLVGGRVSSFPGYECGSGEGCLFGTEEHSSGESLTLTALFCLEGQTEEECLAPAGPTNLRTLTLTKSGNGPGGTGSVSSKPKGIKCGTTCTEAVAAEYKSTPVVLTEKPGGESTFVEWTGACSGSSPTCTVPMAEDESVGAVFAGSSKTITPTEALTLEKEGSGKGTVKAAGLGCEAECTSTTVLYQGPITEPKAKPGKVVVLKQAPAFGSKFKGWSGCDSIDGEGNCVVAMETAKTVKAEYEALPGKTLTVDKAYASGNGSVASKPKGIKCGTACTQAVAQMPEGAAVELSAKPGSETAFVEWVGGPCNGSASLTCTVTMSADVTTKAVFSKASKALTGGSEATLTLNKEGSGFGTVKAAGLGCEVLCGSTSVVYQGPITEPKAKPGKVVVLKALSAPGSKAVEWAGCDSIDGEGNCVVAMETSKSVTATFDELE